MTRALVVQTAFLGDVVLTTPLVSFLASTHDSVDVVCTPLACPILETNPAVANAIPFDKRAKDRGVRGILHLATTLRGLKYDVAYLPHRSLRSALLARAAGIKRRVGYRESPWRFLYTESRPAGSGHETTRHLSLACGTDPGEPIPPMSLTLTREDQDTARRYLTSNGIDPQAPFLVLAPGATWATKRWPHFDELAELLKGFIPMVSVGTDREKGVFRPGSDVVDLAGRLTIRESAVVIEAATAALTNDSAPLHIAGATGTPTLAIFGPTAPNSGFGPIGDNSDVAELENLDCRPCSTHGSKRCPLRHHRCMIDLKPHTVAERLQSMITGITEKTNCDS